MKGSQPANPTADMENTLSGARLDGIEAPGPDYSEAPVNEGLGPLTSAVLESSAKAAADANARLTAPSLFVGECVDARHPTLSGRVLARFATSNGTTRELWMPTLHGLSIRAQDRVLISQPNNWDEPVVVGVIDGFAKRPELPKEPAAVLEVLRDETVRIVGSGGEPLIEVFQAETGPVLRLLTREMNIEVPGRLRMSAESIELNATAGQARVSATDDVIVQGEKVRLN